MEGTLRDTGLSPDFRVIETLGRNGAGPLRTTRHLARAGATCAALGIAFDRAAAERLLEGVAGGPPLRLRLTVDRAGGLELMQTPLPSTAPEWRIALAPRLLDPADPWLRVKTTRRTAYDSDRAALPADIDEWIYANTRGEVCEGTITNLFFDLGTGLCTPPVTCGLLPGVLRAELLEAGTCLEAPLPVSRLPNARLWAGNALRGLIPARLVPAGAGPGASPDAP